VKKALMTTEIQARVSGLGIGISLVSGLLMSLQTQATKHVFSSTIILAFIHVSLIQTDTNYVSNTFRGVNLRRRNLMGLEEGGAASEIHTGSDGDFSVLGIKNRVDRGKARVWGTVGHYFLILGAL
jgi:hypothetical protein